LEEHIASIFRVEELVKQETSKKQAASRAPPKKTVYKNVA
jgi:hypothetical protein